MEFNVSQEVVYTFVKNTSEEVRAFFQDFKGRRLAHIRVFRDGGDDIDRLTRKGIALDPKQLGELRAAVDALIAANEAQRETEADEDA